MTIDVDARSRGLALHAVRMGLRLRLDSRATRSKQERADRHRSIREAIAHLRALGLGRVEPVESCGGEATVVETRWA